MNQKQFKILHLILSVGLIISSLIMKWTILFQLGMLFSIWYVVDHFWEKFKKKDEKKPLSEV